MLLAIVPEESRGVMRHILVRRGPPVDNSDDVHVAISAGTNPSDRIDVFALLYLSLHVLVDVGGEAEGSALALPNATAVGELLERGERVRSL
jgi:hypothetical protein